MPTGMHRRSIAPGSGTKTTRADGMQIEMISMMRSTSLVGTQTCRTNPQVSPNGIPTISISPITKGRLAGVGGHTIKTTRSKNRRGRSMLGHDNGRYNCKVARQRWTIPGGYSEGIRTKDKSSTVRLALRLTLRRVIAVLMNED